MTGDVSTGDNPKLGRHKRKYSLQLREYANHALTEAEMRIYDSFFEEIKERHNITSVEDLMMLDLVCFDFIRIKRLHIHIRKSGDVQEFENKAGQKYTKVNEISHLLNAVESQFRQNMKELLLTRKEATKKAIALGDQDFAKWIDAKVVDAKENE